MPMSSMVDCSRKSVSVNEKPVGPTTPDFDREMKGSSGEMVTVYEPQF